MRWTVVIPAKALPGAKSRLLPATAGAEQHRTLVEALRADTLTAARSADGVARVLLVVDRRVDPSAGAVEAADEAADEVMVQRRPGLNPALAEAADHASARWPEDGVATLLGDLPALRPAELAAVLAEAAAHPRAFVPDSEGTGTTLLTAAPGTALEPRFGEGSAARHADGAVRLDAGPGLRRDVDTAADLRAAVELGLGPRTAAVVRALLDAENRVTASTGGNTRRST